MVASELDALLACITTPSLIISLLSSLRLLLTCILLHALVLNLERRKKVLYISIIISEERVLIEIRVNEII
jgi:hypothetical protein